MLFLCSVWIKGLAGVIEAIGGVLVLFVTRDVLDSFLLHLTAPELADDPADWIMNYLRTAVQGYSDSTRHFASAYLIIHGLIKIFLVAGLLRGKLWAYPLSLWFLGAFIVYQCYRFMHTFSMWLVFLTVFDLVVVFLIWREYQRRQAVHGKGSSERF